MGRLRQRVDYACLYDAEYETYYWEASDVTYYVYDGMRVIQERSGLYATTPATSYTRGNDLSGSMEGAGGIGGLLARSHGYSGGNWSTHNFYHADGNGNITYLVNSSQGLAASYRYDPYGRTISSSGSLASANGYRFSSKEHFDRGIQTGWMPLYYYGYRWYAPIMQRWVNRDPLGEAGFEVLRQGRASVLGDGPNLYEFIRNQAINSFDPQGLDVQWDPNIPTPQIPGGSTDYTPDGQVVLDASCTKPIFSIRDKDPDYDWKWRPLPSGENRIIDGIGWWGPDGRQHGFKIPNGNKCTIRCDSQGYPTGQPDCKKIPFFPKCGPWQPGQPGLPPVPGEGTWD